MKQRIKIIALSACVLFAVSCDDDVANIVDIVTTPNAGTISGGPFTFTVGDGTVDNVSGITVSDDAVGTNSSWIVTNDSNEILGLPGTLTDLEGNDFDGAGVGICYIYYIRYEDGLAGLETGSNTSDLTGSFDLSNSITVNREADPEAMGTLTLNLSGLEDLGDDFVYEGWVIVDGSPVTTGVFSVGDEGALSETSFEVLQSDLDNATMFVLSIEPTVDTDPAPADTKLLSGTFSDGSASVETGIVGDFSDAAGIYFLRTPTDETDGNNENDENGVWFGNPADASASLILPTLPDGWAYEGWVVGESGPLTTGTFTAFDVADDASPYSGDQGGPALPGEDFFNNAPDGETFPLDITGRTIVISIEPVPDNSAAPFAMKPLLGTAGTETAPTTYDLEQNLGSLPTGTVSF